MFLYHVTSEIHKAKSILESSPDSNNFRRARERGFGWIEEVLEDRKPADAPSRRIAIFGFEDKKFCGAFVDSEDVRDPHYYKLDVERPWKCPMVLVDIVRRLGKGSPRLPEVADEYWKPTKDWKLLECLFTEAIVLEEVVPPENDEIAGGKHLYMSDLDLAKKLYLRA